MTLSNKKPLQGKQQNYGIYFQAIQPLNSKPSKVITTWNFFSPVMLWKHFYTANVYRQTTDKLMFKSVISTQRWVKKLNIVECAMKK